MRSRDSVTAGSSLCPSQTETAAPLSTHLLGPLRPHAAAPLVTLGPEASQRTTFLGAGDASGSSSLHAWVEDGIARTGQTGEKLARREKLEVSKPCFMYALGIAKAPLHQLSSGTPLLQST